MEYLIDFVDKWQTLIGSVIGGIFALGVALLVAYKARRQEDLSAGMLLVGPLVSVRAAHNSLTNLAKKDNIADEDFAYWLAEKLVWNRPKLSPLFESSIARVMPLNSQMAAHLDLFLALYTNLELHLERLQRDFDQIREKGTSDRSNEAMRADAKLVRTLFMNSAIHAECAEKLVTEQVLSHFPTIHSLRRIFFPSNDIKKCKTILKTGNT